VYQFSGHSDDSFIWQNHEKASVSAVRLSSLVFHKYKCTTSIDITLRTNKILEGSTFILSCSMRLLLTLILIFTQWIKLFFIIFLFHFHFCPLIHWFISFFMNLSDGTPGKFSGVNVHLSISTHTCWYFLFFTIQLGFKQRS